MATVTLSNAKNRFSTLVDQVEEGHEVTITRRGKPVARLVPMSDPAIRGRGAVENLRALQRGIAARGEVFTWEELRACRDDGRR